MKYRAWSPGSVFGFTIDGSRNRIVIGTLQQREDALVALVDQDMSGVDDTGIPARCVSHPIEPGETAEGVSFSHDCFLSSILETEVIGDRFARKALPRNRVSC